MIQQLYNTVDLIFLGQFLGTEASAAVGASSLLVTCLVGFFTGMSVGASVIAAQCWGSGDETRLSRAIHTSVALSLTGGLLLSAVGRNIAPWFLEVMDTPPEIRGMALSYIRIYFLGFTSVVVYNIGSGILRAAGNAGFPMICQLVCRRGFRRW